MLVTIIAVAVVAFLIVLCIIYFEDIKNFFKNKFGKPKKQAKEPPKKEEKKPEVNIDDFIPLKNQYDVNERDESLNALFAEEQTYGDEDTFVNDDGEKLFMGDVISNQQTQPQQRQSNGNFSSNNFDFDKMFEGQFEKKQKTNKPISEQIQDLSPELKAMLIDSLLKKRDDV